MVMRLVFEGMKLQPCNPGFVDGRDAILAADVALYGGAHLNALWAGFARRGLGFSATQGSSSTNSDNFEAFDLPPLPPAAGFLANDEVQRTPAGGTSTAQLELWNRAAAGSQNLNYLAAVINTDGVPGNDPFLTVDVPVGTVAPGTSTTLTLTFDATQPPFGTRTATLRLATTDPENPSIEIPITMMVVPALANTLSEGMLPTEYALLDPAPNPIASSASMPYALPEAADVRIEVLDLLGRRVATVLDGRVEAGVHSSRFDASGLAAGVYVVRMQAGDFAASRRVVVQ
jgi:hypothetical protein